MTQVPLSEQWHNGGFLVSEANGHRSRDRITLTGSAKVLAGAVLGRIAFGVPAGVAPAGVAATGLITIATNPAASDTLTIAGTAITFEMSGASGNQVNLGGTPALTAAALLTFLQASVDANLVKCTYAASGSTGIAVTAAAVGTGGNALTLATSVPAKITLSGATLAGGAHNTGNATIGAITAGGSVKTGAYVITCLTATTASVYDPSGDYLGTTTFGTAFADAQVNFTITAGTVPCIAGDTFTITANTGSGKYVPVTASAADGSQIAAAILFATTDATLADQPAPAVLRAAEVNASELVWDASLDASHITAALAQLAALGIIAR